MSEPQTRTSRKITFFTFATSSDQIAYLMTCASIKGAGQCQRANPGGSDVCHAHAFCQEGFPVFTSSRSVIVSAESFSNSKTVTAALDEFRHDHCQASAEFIHEDHGHFRCCCLTRREVSSKNFVLMCHHSVTVGGYPAVPGLFPVKVTKTDLCTHIEKVNKCINHKTSWIPFFIVLSQDR